VSKRIYRCLHLLFLMALCRDRNFWQSSGGYDGALLFSALRLMFSPVLPVLRVTMSQKSFDILAVGNAIIDVFSQCDDDFLRQHAIEKGGMTLIDAATSQTLFDAVTATAPAELISGGSAANTGGGIGGAWWQGGFCRPGS
jgi:hypothetical protein